VIRNSGQIKSVLLCWMPLFLLLSGQLCYAQGADFDHARSGFFLDGQHQFLSCDNCHVRGVFRGTPQDCAVCHSRGGVVSVLGKPLDHINSTQNCRDCHNTSSFSAVPRVDHAAVMGSCTTCHNGTLALGKSNGHIQSSNTCDDCHNTRSFSGAVFDHAGVTGSCASCHNGTTAPGSSTTATCR